MFSSGTAVSFVVYITAICVIAVYAYQRTNDDAGFLLANRELPPWLAALSAGASDMSGWLLLGLPGLAYVAGGDAFWLAAGLFSGTWLNWRFVAQPLRRQSAHYGDSLTLPEFFGQRFPDHNRLLKVSSAILILIFYVFYISAGFVAGGKLFSTVFDLSYELAVTIGALIVVGYTLWGGFRAVVLTDALQASLMLFALVAVAAAVVFGSLPHYANTPLTLDAATGLLTITPLAAASALAWGLGYPGQPHIVVRFMAMRDADETPRARRIAVAWTGTCLLSAVAIGALAAGTSRFSIAVDDPERIFLMLVGSLFHPLVAGIFLAAILAAIMSTADSQLLVAASAAFRDLRRPGRRRAALGGLRVTVAVLALIAGVMALEPDNTVLGLVAYAWAGFGATLGPVLILSLYWPRTTGLGAIAGMLSGATVVWLWERASGGLFELYALLPGFALNLLVAVSISALHNSAHRDE